MCENRNQQKISLCIPRMETNIHKKNIIETFGKLNIGNIEQIQELPMRNDNTYKLVIISLNLNNSENSKQIYDALSNNNNVKIVYDFPWYWICSKYVNRSTK
jgi:hypothetical protein